MRRARWLFIAVLSLMFVVGPAGIAQAQSYEPQELRFLELINQYRQQNGLEPLLLSAPLSVASEHHSEDMGTYGFFSHTTEGSSYYPIGSGHPERIAQEGYDYNTYTAENLAYGQTTADEVFEAWRISPGHNTNMLGPYKVIGIGLVWVNGTPYWTTDFGAYVDPSASNGGAGGASGGGESSNGAADATSPAKTPAPEAPDVTTQAAPETTSDTSPDSTASGRKETAAADQYTVKQSADPVAKSQPSAEPSAETAASDQYADTEAPATTESAATKQATAPRTAARADSQAVESAPAEAGDSGQGGNQANAAETEPVAARETGEKSQSDAGQAPAATPAVASAEISILPDTGGVPLLPLAAGLALLISGSLMARRALR
ncbi:MAG TPA: CAP domain-containing protein [Rubrobacteraceae bacterium]|nr:CAP domain-containing protein [Rubrobacteraceae bacterium]